MTNASTESLRRPHRPVGSLIQAIGRLIRAGNNDEQVDVAVGRGVTPRLRSENVDALRLEGIDQPFEDAGKFPSIGDAHTGQFPANLGFQLLPRCVFLSPPCLPLPSLMERTHSSCYCQG